MDTIKRKRYTLATLAAGLDVAIQGDPECAIEGVCTIQKAQPGYLTFLMNPLYKKYLAETKASAVIVLPTDVNECPTNAIISRDPYYTYAKIASYFEDKPQLNEGIHSTAVIGNHCYIDSSASIGPHCVIGNNVTIGPNAILEGGCVVGDSCIIGEGTHLDPNVTLYHKIKIGQRVHVSSGTVIGSDGFGLAKHKGAWAKVPQLGSVLIEDDVEIGANCSIDRGAIEDTVIEKGAKLDNLIQVGHNVRIGQNTAIAGCVGISGSTTIGANCLIGGQAGFAGHLTITDNVMVTGGTVVSKSIRNPGVYSSGVGGLVTNREWKKNSARFHRLQFLIERVKALESAFSELIKGKISS